MARMVLVMQGRVPVRVWHDESQAQQDADRMREADGSSAGVELWDVPVGRTVDPAERIQGDS